MISALLFAALVQVPPPPQPLSPGTRYDPSIPTVEQVTGHDVRAFVTPPDQIVRYFEALATAAPDRTKLIRYATSWEGRPLVMLVISSPERMAHLDEVKAGIARLADPRGLTDADAGQLIATLPVVTAIMHGVHGNEITSDGAAMAEAYQLLAAQGDTLVDRILAESLVIIDPMENPDGRSRFVFENTMGQARWPDAATWSAEHDERWPGGRSNHYLFDMNRDLFIQSQPETRGKAAVFEEYHPQIVADLHEMSGNSTYFFPPTAPPENPWFTKPQIQLMDVFGQANAAAFDARGFAYFNRDTYDLFYPGYVDMWPMSQGALGMTYEQASPRALVLLRADGDTLTYGDGVLHHFTAAMTTMETAARNRESILRGYLTFRRGGVAMGEKGPAEYVIHSQRDPGMAKRLAIMLVRNGIEVHRASGPVRLGARTIPQAGTFIVPLAQPNSRLARILLDADVPMDSAFIRRQIERRARRERDEIYDVTAWSQPLLWDVDADLAQRPTGASGDLVTLADTAATPMKLPAATVGYLMPWGTNTVAAVAEALRAGIRVHSSGGDFTLGGRHYGVATAIVRTSDNGPALAARLGAIAAKHHAEVVPVDDSYVREGTSLGSGRTRLLKEPRVLLVYDSPGSSLSTGWARYVLERRYGQRTTAVRASSLGRVTLSDYDVVVFPSGNYSSVVGKGLVDRLMEWMRQGGTLVTLGESSRWATGENVGLLATHTERRGGRAAGTEPPKEPTPDQPIDYLGAIAPRDEAPEAVPGAILRAILDTDHWLAAGMSREIGVFAQSSRVFSPITLDHGENVGRYADVDSLVMSGIVWDEAQPQLANKAWLIYQPTGSGQLIAFAEDPNYRAYTEASMLLFMNAVLLGPGR